MERQRSLDVMGAACMRKKNKSEKVSYLILKQQLVALDMGKDEKAS